MMGVHDDYAAATLGDEMRNREIAQPEIAAHVRPHDLVESLVGQTAERAVIRVHGGVTDEGVEAPEPLQRAGHKGLDLGLARDVARDHDRVATRGADALGHRLARLRLAARHNHLGAEPSQKLGRRAADAAARSGDDRHLAGQVEGCLHHGAGSALLLLISRSRWRMSLVRNERIKLLATYFNGLGVAAAAVGGIGQIVNVGRTGLGWSTMAWIVISLALHSVGQILLGRLRQ
jgi:hypothetical protein